MSQLLCNTCKEYKDESLFVRANKKARGYAWVCKPCKKANRIAKQNSMSEYDWKIQNRKYWLKTQYGMTLEQFNQKLRDQNHKCAICKCDETEAFSQRLYVDHCHKTNKIRDLLCHACNTALGKFRESKEILSNALAYLEKHK